MEIRAAVDEVLPGQWLGFLGKPILRRRQHGICCGRPNLIEHHQSDSLLRCTHIPPIPLPRTANGASWQHQVAGARAHGDGKSKQISLVICSPWLFPTMTCSRVAILEAVAIFSSGVSSRARRRRTFSAVRVASAEADL